MQLIKQSQLSNRGYPTFPCQDSIVHLQGHMNLMLKVKDDSYALGNYVVDLKLV